MSTGTVTSKGQITIPKDVRDALRLEEGHRVEFRVRPDGVVELIPLNVDILGWHRAIKPDVRGVTIADMDPRSERE